MKNNVMKNASWMIGAKLVQSMLAFVISMLTARYLGPGNYGLVNYAASVAAFFAPVMQLGLNSVLVHEIIKHPSREGQSLGTAVALHAASAGLCYAGVLAFSFIANAGETETIIVCALYGVSLMTESVHALQYWFQAKLLSRYSSLAMVAAYVGVSVYRIALLSLGASVRWFAVANALDILMIDVLLLRSYYRCGGQKLCFSWQRGKEMLAQSRHYILPNMMIMVFTQTDRVMIKSMVGAEQTGQYAAAVACASLTAFVFSAIIDSMRPGILASKNTDEKAFAGKMTQLFTVLVYLSLVQCVVIFVFAPLIVSLLYGAAYAPAAGALRIMVWYTMFSYLGAARDIWVLANGQQRVLFKIYAAGAAANIGLNGLLIPRFGIHGAAAASLVTQLLMNVVLNGVYKECRTVAILMARSLSVQNLKDAIGIVLKKQEME